MSSAKLSLSMSVVDLLRFLLQLYGAKLLHELRQFSRFINADTVSNAVRLFYELREMLVSDDLVVLVPAEDCVPAPEAIEAVAEYVLI